MSPILQSLAFKFLQDFSTSRGNGFSQVPWATQRTSLRLGCCSPTSEEHLPATTVDSGWFQFYTQHTVTAGYASHPGE